MKSGSLVVYIGGQTPHDIDRGQGLSGDVIYTVDKIGWNYFGGIKKDSLSLVERPGEFHFRGMFKEILPPDAVDIEALLEETAQPEKVKVVKEKEKVSIK